MSEGGGRWALRLEVAAWRLLLAFSVLVLLLGLARVGLDFGRGRLWPILRDMFWLCLSVEPALWIRRRLTRLRQEVEA